MELKNRVAVITGGSKGMGASTARVMHREGAKIALLDLDESGARLAGKLGPRGLFIRCDVSNGREVEQAFRTVFRRFGGVDILVNNAGILSYHTVTETPEEEWDRTMNVNLKSAFLCAKQAIPSMLRRGKGVVINVASVQSFISQSKVAAYVTSKTALLGLTRSIAVDYAPKVRCLAVCPGTVDTPMLQRAIQESPDPAAVLEECRQMHLLKRIGKPEEIAELIAFLVGDKAAFVTGQYVRIDGGLGVSIGGSKRD